MLTFELDKLRPREVLMDKPLQRFILICSIAFAVVPAFAQSPARPPSSVTQQSSGLANGPGNPTLDESGRPLETISVKDGRFTLKVVNRRMDSLVAQITLTTHIPIVDMQESLDRHAVSFEFQNMPLDEALRLILKDYDTFFLYGGDGDAPATLRQVWIYTKGQGRGFDPIPHESCASGKELRAMVRGGDPNVQARAFQALVEREGSNARDVVVQWLNSGDEQERNLALFYAMGNNVELPTETLMKLAVADDSPAIRVMALEALAGADPSIAEGVFQQALKDTDPLVSGKAQEIIERLQPSSDGVAGVNQDQPK
jgi:hypothetical protein